MARSRLVTLASGSEIGRLLVVMGRGPELLETPNKYEQRKRKILAPPGTADRFESSKLARTEVISHYCAFLKQQLLELIQNEIAIHNHIPSQDIGVVAGIYYPQHHRPGKDSSSTLIARISYYPALMEHAGIAHDKPVGLPVTLEQTTLQLCEPGETRAATTPTTPSQSSSFLASSLFTHTPSTSSLEDLGLTTPGHPVPKIEGYASSAPQDERNERWEEVQVVETSVPPLVQVSFFLLERRSRHYYPLPPAPLEL
ncbi:hypothetical protein E4T56_gene20260 [Termitomyces sp. T112]|nr:hypothetical protein E4T56_gene20260 [Termitomyces sp. T112]